ncbi:MAG TPA: hypothetical protein VGD14_25635 [bacterium]
MKLSEPESNMFHELYYPLLYYTNQKRRLIPDVFTVRGLRKKSSEQLKIIRNVLFQQLNLFDQFIFENPFHFSSPELEIVDDWKHSCVGKYFIFRETNYYTIFLSNIKPIKAYGVMALNKEFNEIFTEELPIYIETALLPFKDKIITDGIFSYYRLKFGAGFARNLQKSYQQAIDQEGLIVSL